MSLQTNFPQVNQNIPIKEQHSAVLAYLGQLALSRPAAADLFADVITLVANMLPADFVWLWELGSDGDQLTMKTSSSWSDETGIEAQLPVEPKSLEALVLRSAYPIVVPELKIDLRFKPSSFLKASGATSGLAVIIGTVQKPFGILEVFSEQSHTFSPNDIHFLHSVANILGLFMDLKHQETIRAVTQKDLLKPNSKTQLTSQPDPMERDQQEIKSRLVEGRERERLRLAQEIHDIPIQDLYGIMYQLDDLKEIIKDTNGKEILEDFNTTLHRVLNNLRAVCGELRPPSLSPFGLEVAIRDHVEKLRNINPGIQFHLELMRDQQTLSDGIRLCLFRVYQQAISNVVRHSQATDAYIRFRWDDQDIILEVEDNGIGFELPARWVDLVRQECFGLVGIAERVESVQGKLEIVSTPGEGTSVRVRVPRR